MENEKVIKLKAVKKTSELSQQWKRTDMKRKNSVPSDLYSSLLLSRSKVPSAQFQRQFDYQPSVREFGEKKLKTDETKVALEDDVWECNAKKVKAVLDLRSLFDQQTFVPLKTEENEEQPSSIPAQKKLGMWKFPAML